MAGLGGFGAGVFGFAAFPEMFRLAVAIVLVGFAFHGVARAAVGRSTPLEGLVSAVLAVLVSGVVHGLLRWQVLAVALSLLAFVAVVRLIFRAPWSRSAGVGAAGFLVWMVLGYALTFVVT